MKCVYIGDGRLLLEPTYGARLIVPSRDLSVTPELAMTGSFEAQLTRFLLNQVKRGDVAVDVGAHVGYFSVLLGHLVGPEGRLFCYEANPETFRFLRDNLSINFLHDRTTAIPKAAYDTETSITYYASRRFYGNSTIKPHDAQYFQHYDDVIEAIEVEAEPLRATLSALDHVDWLKIDIEGGEYRAFKGMQELIECGQIRRVIFELNRPMMRDDYEAFCKLLFSWQDKGRRFFTLDADGVPVSAELARLLAGGSCPFVLML